MNKQTVFMINDDNYTYVSDYIYQVLEQTKSDLEPDVVEAVVHYETHGEYEIAFELLFSRIIKLSKVPLIDYAKALEVARICELDEETVLDVDFWTKFQIFAKSNSSRASG